MSLVARCAGVTGQLSLVSCPLWARLRRAGATIGCALGCGWSLAWWGKRVSRELDAAAAPPGQWAVVARCAGVTCQLSLVSCPLWARRCGPVRGRVSRWADLTTRRCCRRVIDHLSPAARVSLVICQWSTDRAAPGGALTAREHLVRVHGEEEPPGAVRSEDGCGGDRRSDLTTRRRCRRVIGHLLFVICRRRDRRGRCAAA